MTEPFDAELSQAFKQHEAESLDGWEFTPTMQRQVLERLRQEEEGAVAPARRTRRPLHMQPLVWVAVAAAAFMIVINTGIPGRNGMKSSPSRAGSSAAPTAAPRAMSSEPSQAAPAAPAAPTPVAPDAGTNQAAGTAPASGASEPQPKAESLAPAGAGKVADAVPPVTFDLRAPEGPVPAPGPTLAAPRFAAAQGPAPSLLAAPAVAEARELGAAGVKAVDSQGATLWQTPVAGLTAQSQLAVSADGHSAVSLDSRVLVLGPTGNKERSLSFPAAVRRMAWSADGRLAVATNSVIAVYRGETLQYTVSDAAGAEMLFSPDGMLAVVSGSGTARSLSLYDYNGTRLTKTTLSGPGSLLGFSPDGTLAEVGSKAYDRTGSLVWQAPIEPDGAAALPNSDLVLFWSSQTALAVSTGDGHAVWQARYGGPGGLKLVAPSAGGRYLALVASLGDGSGALWVLDRKGEELYTERLTSLPTGIAFAGERLLLETGREIQVRTIAP